MSAGIILDMTTFRADGGDDAAQKPGVRAQWIEAWYYDVLSVRSLPPVMDLEDPPSMVGVLRRRRIRRQGAGAQSCCWWHAGDWNRASALAIQLAHEAGGGWLEEDDLFGRLWQALQDAGIDGWLRGAVGSLVMNGHALQIGPGEDAEDGRPWIIEGRHRITATRDAGVRETIVAHLELLDPVTHGPLLRED